MEAIAETLESAYSAVNIKIQVEPRLIVNPTPPTIDIYPGDPPRETATAGFGDIAGGVVFTIRARVRTADHVAGQDLLIAFMDDEDDLCVARPLMDEPTLGGLAHGVFVEPPTGYGLYPDPGGEGALLGCQWRVTVLNVTS
jgi:hypothetical protein